MKIKQHLSLGKRYKAMRLILLLSLTIHFQFLYGYENSGVQHEQIGNNNGLSNSAVTITYEDSKGYIWLGTWDGLNRYDGTEIFVFKPNPLKSGFISNNIIRNIFEDSSKNLWVVTENGINRYNYSDDSFESYLVNYNTQEYKENLYIAKPSIDGNVYCLIKDIGFYRYEEKNNNFDILRSSTSKGIINFFIDKSNTAYFIYKDGTVENYSLNPYKQIRKYYLNQQIPNTNWIIECDSINYVAYPNSVGKISFIPIENSNLIEITLPSKMMFPTTITVSKNKNAIWIGCDNGEIITIKNLTSKDPIIQKINLPEVSELNIKIWDISESSTNLIWIGTDGNGVHKYSFNGKPFHSLIKGDIIKGSLSHNIVRAIIEDKNGNIYIGTRGSGVNIITKNAPTQTINNSNGLSNNAVLSLGIDKYENIWIGTDGEGIDMLDKKSNKIYHFPHDFLNAPNLKFRSVYAICMDTFGNIWIGTSGYGIIQLLIERNSDNRYRVKHVEQFNTSTQNGLLSNIIYAIEEGEPNTLWVGSRGGGLQKFNTLTKKFQSLKINNKEILINNDVLSICYAQNQELWVGTSGGLNQINLSQNPLKVTYYTENTSLANNTIHAIEQDKSGNIWVSTNKGLSKIDKATKVISNFNSSNGLSNFEYTDGASFRSENSGNIYFGGINGIDWFQPDSILISRQFPRLIISDFYINQEKQLSGKKDSPLTKHINETDTLILQHNQNFFSFSLTTLNFQNKTKTEYAYILENFYPEWTKVKDGRNISFTNVPIGKYKFKVRWTNEDEIWNNDERSIFIEIKPAWYQTIIAYIFYYLIILSLTILLFRFYIWREKEKNKLVVQEIKYQKLEEMNQYKLQFFTNIAHEFRTPLTLIMAPAISLLEKFENDTIIAPSLKIIHNNAKKLIALIAELTDFRKVETGNRQLKIQFSNLTETINKIVEVFYPFAEQNKVHIDFVKKINVLGWFDSNVIEKIVTNLISNAIKYTPMGGKVTIEIEQSDKNAIISIIDTGIGIPKEVQKKVFDRFFYQFSELPKLKGAPEGSGVGLALTKSLIDLHRGTIVLNSSLGKGSVFKVTIPIQKELFTEAETIETENFSPLSTDPYLEFVPEINLNKTLKLPLNNIKILIVDDNYQIRELLKDVLNEYNLIEAEDGQDAVSIISAEHIDMVISDIIMPIMDGLELCRYIKQNFDTCHIPVILLTAKGSIEHRIEGIEEGADSYIPKPFDPRHLKARVFQLIESRNKLRQAIANQESIPTNFIVNYDTRDSKFIKSLNQFINKNIDVAELNSESMMQELSVSKTQLYRKVKALTDLTPHGYLKKIRIKTALNLLETTDLSVSEIIDKTGFNNRTYFYRTFKEEYGTSPKEYIKKPGS
jgi:signal transduction histidine kinase/DNA-binding response OmpR family regulator/ligand-binding sensor domain-containing protein